MSAPHIRLVEVTKTFPARGRRSAEPVTALDGVSLEVPHGSITGIVGYSGAGKSTLVRLINALERPSSGHVWIGDTDLTLLSEAKLQRVRSSIGMVFQHFNLFTSRTVAGNIGYPLKVAGWKKSDISARVDELLGFVGLADKANVYPQRLSGGQKQRVGIARALATHPEILLADEATSALDPRTTAEVLALLKRVNAEFGTTVVIITHEMSVVREICDRVVMMDQGRVLDSGNSYDVFASSTSAVTRRFVSGATHSQPSAETVDRLAERNPGVLATVAVRADFGTQDIADAFARHSLRASVVYGGVTEVSDQPLGALTYAIAGSQAGADKALGEIAEHTDVELLRSRQSAVGNDADAEVLL